MSFFEELKRRNVFRVGIAYALVAWVLLQVVDLVLDNITAPEWIMKVFMLVVAIGFPVALIIAWAFEMTPEGLKREADVDRSRSITPQTGHKLDRIIIAFLAVAVLVLLAERFVTTPEEAESDTIATLDSAKDSPVGDPAASAVSDKSIAVLPLVNRSALPEDAFFADGMHDELLTQLSRVAALRVISRTSVMGYAGTTKRMPEIGRELGVANLLEGGVQRSGNRVRINVQLIDAATDEHLWAEVYDRELTANNLFDIQSDITQAIARALRAVLTGQEQRVLEQKPTENLEAYAYYLRGKVASSTYGRGSAQIDESIVAYRKAIDLDPGFAAAYAALSTDLIEHFWINGRVGDVKPARQALEKARELAPEAAETRIAEGYFYYWGNLDYATAIDAFDRALAVKPGDLLAIRGRAYTLRRMGRLEDSLADFRKILSIDPLNGSTAVEMAYTLSNLGRFDEAFSQIAQARALGIDHGFMRFVEALLLTVESRLDEAKVAIGPLPEALAPVQVSMWFQIGRFTRNDALVGQVVEHSERYPPVDDAYGGIALQRASMLWDRGQKSELATLVNTLEPKFLKLLETSPDQAGPLSGLITIYAMRGDRARLDETVYRYDHDLKPDALRPVEVGYVVPKAYAMLGDAKAAMDRIEPVIEQFGIWEFYRFSMDPVFDSMRDNPRFQVLDQRYQQWLKTRKQ